MGQEMKKYAVGQLTQVYLVHLLSNRLFNGSHAATTTITISMVRIRAFISHTGEKPGSEVMGPTSSLEEQECLRLLRTHIQLRLGLEKMEGTFLYKENLIKRYKFSKLRLNVPFHRSNLMNQTCF